MLESLVTDPYRYLEDAADPRAVAWTANENARTRAALDALPGRAALAARFEELTRIDSAGVPVERGPRTFSTGRRGTAAQTVLYVRSGDEERVLLDPAALDPSGLTALDWWYPSPFGRYVAVGLSSGGDERSTLFVLDAATGERLGEAIPDTRQCSLAWRPGEDGFLYTRYPPGGQYDVRVYRHDLGAPWESDPLVFGEGRRPQEWISVALSDDGRRAVATVFDGWARSEVFVAAAADEALVFVPVAAGRDALYDALPAGDRLYVRTDDDAPNFRLYEVDYARSERNSWREIVAEGADALDGIALASGALVLHYLVAARSALKVRFPSGRVAGVAGFHGQSVLAISACESSPVVDVLHASYFAAPAVTRLTATGEAMTATTRPSVTVPFDASAYLAEQLWYPSRDGTRIPLTVIARRDVPRDGSAPAVLYGYGGFNVSLLPAFTPAIVPWLDAGGVYAIANLRGGGEFGEAWHRAGMRERKQNVFDDCIGAADYLGTSGIADPRRLALMGGSNGGLLVASVATQRPDIARAVVCLVPLTDMLRFHEFLIARLWIPEYGDPDDPRDAEFLRAYSPYHNVREGVAYPAMLISAAEGDSRVDPMHAKKFGARLRAASRPDARVYINVEADAGHGVGKPRRKRVAELTDQWAFIGAELGVEYAGRGLREPL